MTLRRILSLFLLFSMLLSLIPTPVFAGQTRTPTLSTDAAVFAKLNLNAAGLSEVKRAVSAGNYTEAKALLLDYYKSKFADYAPGYATAAVGSVAVAALQDTFTFSEPLQSSVNVAYSDSKFTEYAFALTKDVSAAYVLSALDKTSNQVRICSSEHSSESVRPKLLCYDSSKKVIGTLSASADSYVDCGKPDTGYGSSTYLYAKDHYTHNSDGSYSPYGSKTRRVYIKFDTAQIPKGTKYTQLVIHARVEGSGTETSIALYQFVSYWKTWTEENLTWNYLLKNDGIGHYSWKGIPGGFDWKEPEGVTNQWYAYNSRFLQMTSLLQQGIAGNKQDYIAKAKELLLDFVNDVTMTESWEHAGGIQSGNRLMEFPYIYKNLLAYSDLTPDENLKILAWLYDEMVYMDAGGGLFNNTDPSAHKDLVYTNQGFWLLVGFYCGFAYWPEFSSASAWQARYVSREDLVLNTLIHKDGSFNEVTFGYPYNVLDWYQHLRKCMVELGDPTKSVSKMDSKFIRLCNYLVLCAQPNNYSPNWGQGGAKDITIAVETLLSTIGNKYDSNLLVQDLRNFLHSDNGTQPPLSAQFDDIKVVTDRTGWTAEDSMIFMNAKCAGNHSHRDALALLFYYDGRELLTDTGMTSYSNKHTHYDWQNSISRSHNTIEIDGISQVLYQNLSDVEDRGDIQLSSNAAAATITAMTTANTNDDHTKSLSMDGVVNNKVYHKTDFTHYRNVSFLKALGDLVIVSDKVVPGDSQSHSYTQNWHTRPYSKATVASDSYDTGTTAFDSGPNLTIAQVGSNSITPTIRKGYDSTAASTTTDYFEYKQTAAGTVTYQTVLYPTSEGERVTLKTDKLTMSSTTDAEARAMKASIEDSANAELKTLYYYNSFEDLPTVRAFSSFTTDARTAAVSLNNKGQRSFASVSDGSVLKITSSLIPVLQSSRTVADLAAYMEGSSLYIESSDSQLMTAGLRVNLQSSVEKVYLNGKSVAFTVDSKGTVSLKGDSLILHFNENSPLNNSALWTATRCTVQVDTAPGSIYGEITSYDPHFETTNGSVRYFVREGDVMELRLKVTSTNSADKGTQIFFLTEDDSTWNSTKSKFFTTASVNQGYQILNGMMPDSAIGKTLTALRIDPVNTDKTSTSTGSYEVDYLYIGPAETAPSKQADRMLFDFDKEEASYHNYQSKIYGGRNYDAGCWSVNEGRNSLPSFDPAQGTAKLWIAQGADSPYLQTSNGILDKAAFVLDYEPHSNDYLEIRFKLENCAVKAGTNPSIRMYYIKDQGTMGNSDYVPVAIPQEAFSTGEYVTLRKAMTTDFTSASEISAIRPTFLNVCSTEGKIGSVTIDYIYIGAGEARPIRTYQVSFVDAAGKLLESSTVASGETASYKGADPTMDYDANYHYIFKGWDKALTNITADTVFTAQFAAVAHSYTYSLIDQDEHKALCDCGYSISDGHEWNSGSVTTEPSCTAEGIKTYTCDICRGTKTELIPKKGHTEVIDKAVESTCTETGLTEGKHCSVCSAVLVAQQTVPANGHIDTSPKDNKCDVCTARIAPAVLRFRTISLKGNIAVNYYMDLEDDLAQDETAYMLFTLEDGEQIKVPATEGIKTLYQKDYYYVFTCPMTAKEMADIITCQFFYGEGETQAYTYSVKTYADNILASNAKESLRNLLYAMLNYGAASQIHFEYHTDRLANEGLEVPDYSAVSIEGFPINKDQGTALARFAGASLLLTSETTLRVFFKVDASVESFTASYNGKLLPLGQRSGLYYADIPNISAKDLDEYYTLVIHDGTETAEVSYAPMSYCASILANVNNLYDRELQDCVAAMYLYNQAANVYFAG